MPTEELKRTNPYVGPRALRYGEHIYGRDHESLDLRDLLIAERIVLLYSPSGAGKTSLIQAGLIPEMEKEEFKVLPVMRVGKSSNGAHGNRYVASALLSLEENRAPNESSLSGDFLDGSFAHGLKMLNGSERSDSTLLIFDQFEEILTTDPLDRDAKTEFFNQIGELLRDPGRWALFSIREDYVAGLDPYLRVLPTRLKSTFRLDLLTTDCARRAIQEPARELGVEFTEEATTRLVDDLREVSVQGPSGALEQRLGPYVEPVQLQVVCFRLWEKPRPDPGKITVAEVTATGDVDSALAEFYAERVQQVAQSSGVQERTIREWFERSLITEAGIRGEVMKGAESSAGLSNVAIQQLETAHLVRREERRGVNWLELSHDRLVRPIRADNAKWFERNLSVLQQQATLWERQDRSDILCLRGDALAVAEQWGQTHPEEISETEREFLVRSREIVTAEEHARSARRARKWLLVLATIAAITLVLGGIAFWQRFEAKQQAKIASVRALATHAQRLLNDRLDRAILLSYEAQRKADLPETRGTLLTAALTNPRLISFLHGQQATIGALAFTPDRKFLAVGDYKNRITLWNTQTYRPEKILTFDQFKDVVRWITFSPDEKYMAACSKDGSIILRDLKSGEVLAFPNEGGHVGNIWSVAFSPDSKLLASGGSDEQVIIWNVERRVRLWMANAKSAVRSVAFNINGSFLAAGCAGANSSGEVLIWQNQNGTWVPFDDFAPHEFGPEWKNVQSKQVTCVAFSPKDENLLAIASKDRRVTLRNAGQQQYVARGWHGDSLTSLAFSPDGTSLITAGQDGILRLWKIPKEQSPAAAATAPPAQFSRLEQIGDDFTGHVGWVLAVAFSPDGRTVASGGIDREAILWDTRYFPRENTNADSSQQDSVVALSADGRYEVSGDASGQIVCRDRATGAQTRPVVHPRPVHDLCFSRDSRILLSTGSDTTGRDAPSSADVIITDFPPAATEPLQFEIPCKISSATLSADGKLAAVATDGTEILIWDILARKQIEVLEGKDGSWNYAVAFSSDGKKLAAGGDNQSGKIWELGSKSEPIKLGEHNGSVRAIAFSPDGKIVVTGSGDHTILFWDSATGRQLGPPLTAHRGPVRTLAFSLDGTMLASGSDDQSIVLWDVGTQQQYGPRLVRHAAAVRALSFGKDRNKVGKDGNKLFSTSTPNDTVEWDLDPKTLPDRCRARANRNLTEQEWKVFMGKERYRKTWPELPWPTDDVSTFTK